MSCGKNGESLQAIRSGFCEFVGRLHQLIPEKVKVCEKHSFLRKLEHTPDPELAVYGLKILSLIEFWGYLGWSVGFF